MSLLLELPNELLTHICHEILIDDETLDSFRDLALSCRAMYSVARLLLEEFTLIKKFRQFSFQKKVRSSRGWIIQRPFQLLYEMATEPRIGNIMRIADLRYDLYDNRWYDNRWDDEGRAVGLMPYPYISSTGIAADLGYSVPTRWIEIIPTLALLLRRNPYLKKLEVDPAWWLHMIFQREVLAQRGDSNFEIIWSISLLLSMMDNVELLAIGQSSVDALKPPKEPEQLIRLLVEQANSQQGQTSTPLSKVSFDLHQWLLSLNSLEVFTHRNMIAYGDDESMEYPLRLDAESFPGVKEFVTEHSIINASAIYQLASRMPRVMVFRHSETLDLFEDDLEWGAGDFVGSLAEAVGMQLRALSVTMPTNIEYSDFPFTIRNFNSFHNLEDLETNSNLLTGYSISKNKALVDRLPRSLRRLRLLPNGDFVTTATHTRQLVELFQGWEDRSVNSLPVLEIVEIVVGKFDEWEIEYQRLMRAMQGLSRVKVVPEPGFQLLTYSRKWPDWFDGGWPTARQD